MTDHKDLIERLRLGNGTSPDHALLLEAASALEALAQAPAVPAQEPVYSSWKWQHLKSGGLYDLLGDAHLQTDKPLEDMAHVYVYQGEDGRMWVRPCDEFDSRFKRVSVRSAPANHLPDAGQMVNQQLLDAAKMGLQVLRANGDNFGKAAQLKLYAAIEAAHNIGVNE